MRQLHARHGLTDAPRLIPVDVAAALAALDGAERARAGAYVAEDHECRGAVAPALREVRAARLLAHCVQLEPTPDALQPRVALAHRELHGEPRRAPVHTLGEQPAVRSLGAGLGQRKRFQGTWLHGCLASTVRHNRAMASAVPRNEPVLTYAPGSPERAH